jgi:hypothetical protein
VRGESSLYTFLLLSRESCAMSAGRTSAVRLCFDASSFVTGQPALALSRGPGALVVDGGMTAA